MKMSKKTAIARFFQREGQGLKDIVHEVNQLTEQDIDELAPACAKALGAELKADGEKL